MSIKLTKSGLKEILLMPGELFFGGGKARVYTLLGSCVAITLWHPQHRIGGMCHFLLPSRGKRQNKPQGSYADEAIHLFLQHLKRTYTHPKDYEVKVFGGSNMFLPDLSNTPQNLSRANIHSAMKLLNENGFKVLASDVGGEVYRKVFLELPTGYVWVNKGRHKDDIGRK